MDQGEAVISKTSVQLHEESSVASASTAAAAAQAETAAADSGAESILDIALSGLDVTAIKQAKGRRLAAYNHNRNGYS